MYICYVDESGTSDIPGTSSHFILSGLSIPVWHWKDCDREIERIKGTYNLCDTEIHVAWLLRKYLEQSKIAGFEGLDFQQRGNQVEMYRRAELFRLQKAKNPKLYKQTKKNYKQTEGYIHLTHDERCKFVREIATCISQWGFARLFAECIDKVYFNPAGLGKSIDEQSFEQVVSRFERYLQSIGRGSANPHECLGIIIHDNNETVSKKHTNVMKQFREKGTLWTQVTNIIETPLFVDSQLTSMVQIADVCSYALRRYLENNEEELFDLIFERADRKDGVVVGVRHFSSNCSCKICRAHTRGRGAQVYAAQENAQAI